MQNVLLMEDEAILGRNIKRSLEADGISVEHARSAAAAREALGCTDFDLVLADITLGDGNGLDVLAEFHDQLGEIPVVAITGQDSVSNRVRAEELDVMAFLTKPFALSRLREMVGALLSRPGNKSDAARRERRVVMYSHDTIGLGHMRRNSAIARELVNLVPGISVLMLVGCPTGMVFDPYPGIDYVKLPSLAKLARNIWQPSSLRTDPKTTRSLRMGIIERVLETMAPDVLLVDHEPAGVWGELAPSLERLKRRGNTEVVLGLRDILDDPDRIERKWRDSGTTEIIETLYDRIFVYGNEAFYPSVDAYQLQKLKPGTVSYCGIATSAGKVKLRVEAGPPRKVLAAGGGGRDAYPLLSAAIAARELIPRLKRPEMTVVTGPLMDEELRDDLVLKADKAGAELLASVADFPALLRCHDLFVSMAGYNSVNESLAVGCPMIVMPRVGPSSEQRLRAAQLDTLKLARVLHREQLNARTLAKMMQATIAPPAIGTALSFGGARVAALLIAERLNASAAYKTDTRFGGLANVT